MKSGHGIAQLGSYHGCIETSGMDFYSVSLIDRASQAPVTYIGLCLPDSCSASNMNSLINMALKNTTMDGQVQNHIPDITY